MIASSLQCRSWSPSSAFTIGVLLLLALGTVAPFALADSSPPDIQKDVSPAPNTNGWNNTDVSVTWTISDNDAFETSLGCDTTDQQQSGSIQISQTFTNETAGTTATCKATDSDGTSSKSVTIKIDKTLPQINGTQSPKPNNRNWHNEKVTVSFSCLNVGTVKSPIVTNSVGGGTELTNNGADQTVTNSGRCVDAAGNEAKPETVIVNIDKDKPTITVTRKLPNANGWNTTDVTVVWDVSDSISSIVSINGCGRTVLVSETKQTVAKCFATDAAGNLRKKDTVVKIDKTRPEITAELKSPPGGNAYSPGTWTNQDVQVNFNCADTGSVQSSVDPSDPSSISKNIIDGSNQTFITEKENHSVTASGSACIDKAGNMANDLTVNGINIDKTKPKISATLTSPPDGRIYSPGEWTNADVKVEFTCADTGSVQSAIARSTVARDTQTLGEGGNQSVSSDGDTTGSSDNSVCRDKAGNIANTKKVTNINIDETRPKIEKSKRPSNANGWYSSSVDITFECVDLGPSGRDNLSFSSETRTLNAGENQSVSMDGDKLVNRPPELETTRDNTRCKDKAGNVAFESVVSNINVDVSDPIITGFQKTKPNGNGWNNSNVTVEFNCSDTGDVRSGIDEKSPNGISKDTVKNRTITREGDNFSVTSAGQCIDRAGRSADPAKFTNINIDKTKPTITAKLTSPPSGSSYSLGTWTDQNVKVMFEDCKDTSNEASGIVPNDEEQGKSTADISKDTISGTRVIVEDNVDGGTVSSRGRGKCVDQAGNAALPKTVSGIQIDKADPVITAQRTPQPNENGWNHSDVTVTFNCSDKGNVQSGIVSDTATGTTVVNSDVQGRSVTSTGSCSDKAGNMADPATVNGINIDTTKPVITVDKNPEPNANGWNISDVEVSFNCSDTAGPVKSRIDDEKTNLPDKIITQEGTNQTVTSIGDCLDQAGNEADPTQTTVSIDKTAPTVQFSASPSRVTNESTAQFKFEGQDAISKIKQFQCSLDGQAFTSCGSANPPSTFAQSSKTLNNLSEGEHTFRVRAVDVAGNMSVPAERTWEILPPSASELKINIVDGPTQNGFTNDTTATFIFELSTPTPAEVNTECRLDGGAFTPCDSPLTLRNLSEGQHTFEVRGVDSRGNTGDPASRTWSVDLSPPTLTASVSPQPNANGWHNEDVTIRFSCGDPTSNGISSGVSTFSSGNQSSNSGTLEVSLSEEGEGRSRTAICEDGAGNRAVEVVDGINIDKTIPTIASTRTPQPNTNGWNRKDVRVTFECFDTGDVKSGIETDTVAGDTVTSEGQGQTVTNTGECIDRAGNEADTTTVDDINIDKTRPEITSSRDPQPNTNGWNNTNVTVTFKCLDAGAVQSGIARGSVSGSTTLAEERKNQSVSSTGACVDLAGNEAKPVTVSNINIDKTAPSVTLSSPQDGAKFAQGKTVTANFLTSDNLSGIAVVNSPVPNGTAINTNALGVQEFTVTVVDRADNSNTVTHSYQVLLLPPELQAQVLDEIKADLQEQLNEAISDPEFESGDAIQLCLTFEDPRTDERVPNVSIQPELFDVPTEGDPVSIRELDPFQFEEDQGAYCVEFATVDSEGNPLSSGDYELVIAFNDGTAIRVKFTLN